MRGLIASAVLALTALATTNVAEAANTPPTMTAPGQFSVTSIGAATYSMPIEPPPGTAGVVPALSLSYSSQNGDGINGLGFVLSGLSTINRCQRTIAQDGTHGSVNYDNDDRFCLDGQRLMVVSGTYGANLSEYRTEIDSFSKIIAHGSAGNGPAWFEVHTKSGQTLEFGNTADSQVLATGKATPRAWAVSKISDTVGNYMTITYNSASGTERTTYGEVYPLQVDYTGNAVAGVSPYNSVKFVYTGRTDSIPQYQAGSLTQLTVLMTNIRTYQGANLVKDYQLGYRVGTTVIHSRITSVTECDASGSCLKPTTFGWQGGTSAQTLKTTPISGLSFGVINIYADFNADGLTDLATGPSVSACPPYPVQLGTSSSTFVSSSYTLPNPAAGYFVCAAQPPGQTVLSPSGQAAVSLAVLGGNPPAPYTYVYNMSLLATDGALTVGQLTAAPGVFFPNASPIAGDYDGNGIPDALLQSHPNSLFYLGSSGGTFTSNAYTGLDFTNTHIVAADFDGDGCTDVYATQIPSTSGGTNSLIYAPYCHSAASTATIPTATGFSPIFGDFNGDGKTDVILVGSPNSQLWLSTGTGFTNVNSTLAANFGGTVGDWNGDGKADVVGSSNALYLSTGTGFTPALDESGNPITLGPGSLPADWDNDGVIDTIGPNYIYGLNYVPELVVAIDNGIGATTSVSYDRINKNGSFYQKCTTLGVYNCSDTYPVQSVDGPLYVVSRVDATNGLGPCNPSVSYANCYSTTYAYAFGKTNLTGRGFLGFGRVTTTDLQTNIIQTISYSQAFPYIGLATSQTMVHGSTTLSSVTNTFAQDNGCGATPAGSAVVVVCVTETIAASNDLSGVAFPTTTTDYTYDNYENPLTVNLSVSDGSYKNTTNTYSNDTTRWFLGRMLTTSVTSHVASSTITRISSFSYDTNTGLMTQEVIAPGVSTCNSGSSSCTLTTVYTYDNFGNKVTSTVSGTGITTRVSSVVYDPLGQFQIQATNALGQSENWTYDARFGTPATHTGPNLLTTSWTYDGFGRMTQEARPDGTLTKGNYTYCSVGCPTNGAFFTQSESFASDGTTQIGSIGTGYFDSLIRPIATDNQGFTGDIIRVATTYDANERVLQTSRPYFIASDTPRYTGYTYDDLGRVTQATFPDTSHATYGYNGLVTTATNNLSQTSTTTKNAQGLVASVQDAANHTTSYVYNAFGNLLTVTDSVGNVITNAYDIRGNKISSVDPDMGTWTYAYDVLGELINQTDAKSQTTTLTYDLLGRSLSRTESGLFSNWTFGASAGAHNIGKIIDAQTCTASGCASVISERNFTFDSLGRPDATVLHTGSSDYGYHYAYNNTNGQLSNLQYPSGFSVNYSYNTYGYLATLADTSGAPIWAANARDAEMHLISQTQGNGILTTQVFDPNTGLLQSQRAGGGTIASFDYSFDTIGNLTARTDNTQSFTERFCYDPLNRLTNSNIGAACTGGKSAGYDNIGNITNKSGVGTYTYPSTGSARPHAVSSITGAVDGLTNPKYTYDGNGNLACTSTTTGCAGTIGRQLTVTSFNMAATLTQGSTSIALTYDDQHARITQVTTASGTMTTTTYLNDSASGAISQRVQVGSAVPQWVDYIQIDGQIIAQRTVTYQSGSLWGFSTWGASAFQWGPPTGGSKWGSFSWGSGTWAGPLVTWAYFTLDSLNSVAVISDQGANVVQRLSFDPWGKQRNANGTDVSCGTITSTTTRGYTNQEEMPAQCLVNLNARIYDPSIGRFMTPDAIVPDPMDGQAFNRFSYVNNNPLSFTDPTGHFLSDGLRGLGSLSRPISSSFCMGNCGSSSAGGDYSGRFTLADRALKEGNVQTLANLAGVPVGTLRGAFGSLDPNGNGASGTASQATNAKFFIDFGQEGSVTKYNSDGSVKWRIVYLPYVRERFYFSAADTVPTAFRFASGDSDVKGGVLEGGSAPAMTGALSTINYSRLMQACDLADATCIYGVIDIMERNNQPLPMADPRKVISEFEKMTIEWAAEATLIDVAGASVLSKMGPAGPIFGRTSRGGSSIFGINANNALRIGWGWKGSATAGENVFRVSGDWIKALGVKTGHIDIYSAKSGWFPGW